MKTWKDLEHGDVIKNPGYTLEIIDVLPNSAYIRNKTVDDMGNWLSFEELQGRGYQIVQPEEKKEEADSYEVNTGIIDCSNCGYKNRVNFEITN